MLRGNALSIMDVNGNWLKLMRNSASLHCVRDFFFLFGSRLVEYIQSPYSRYNYTVLQSPSISPSGSLCHAVPVVSCFSPSGPCISVSGPLYQCQWSPVLVPVVPCIGPSGPLYQCPSGPLYQCQWSPVSVSVVFCISLSGSLYQSQWTSTQSNEK